MNGADFCVENIESLYTNIPMHYELQEKVRIVAKGGVIVEIEANPSDAWERTSFAFAIDGSGFTGYPLKRYRMDRDEWRELILNEKEPYLAGLRWLQMKLADGHGWVAVPIPEEDDGEEMALLKRLAAHHPMTLERVSDSLRKEPRLAIGERADLRLESSDGLVQWVIRSGVPVYCRRIYEYGN